MKKEQKIQNDYICIACFFGLYDIADKANLTRITIHGLRHSHVSYLISKGLSAYEIAERIGDSVDMVLQVYGHMFPNPQKNIVNVLNDNFNFEYQHREDVLGQKLGQGFSKHKKSPINTGDEYEMERVMRIELT